MNIINRCCCGIDVHVKTAVACLIKNGKKQIRTYSTMTDCLLSPIVDPFLVGVMRSKLGPPNLGWSGPNYRQSLNLGEIYES